MVWPKLRLAQTVFVFCRGYGLVWLALACPGLLVFLLFWGTGVPWFSFGDTYLAKGVSVFGVPYLTKGGTVYGIGVQLGGGRGGPRDTDSWGRSGPRPRRQVGTWIL